MYLSKGAVLVLIVLCLSGGAVARAGEEAYVDLPAEFYFGRWVPGHQLVTYTQWTPEESPEGTARYQFTAPWIRFRIQELYDHIFYNQNGGYVRTLPWSLYVRPATNWQIGVDSAVFWKFSDTIVWPRFVLPGIGVFPPSLETTTTHESYMGLSFSWVNRSRLRIPERTARLAYLGPKLVGPGELLIESSLGFHHLKENSTDSVTDLPEVTNGWQKANSWTINTALRWSPLTNMNLLVEIPVTISRVRESYVKDSQADIDSSRSLENQESRGHSLGYSLTPILSEVDNVYLTARWSQRFSASSDCETTDLLQWTNDSLKVSSSDTRTSVSERSDQGAFKLEYLSAGEFHPSIVVDDYRNYYRRMLSKGQLHFLVAADYFRDESPWEPLYGTTLSTVIGIGLEGHWEIGAEAIYGWGEYIRFKVFEDWWEVVHSASIRSQLTIRWRSFEYEPIKGPGWYTDTPMDASFGPLLSSGQVYASLKYQHPHWHAMSYDGRKPLGASQFVSDRIGYVSIQLECGVSSYLMFTSQAKLQYRTDGDRNYHTGVMVLEKNEYALGLTVRPVEFLEAAVTYSNFYDRYDGRYGEQSTSNLVRLDIRGLLR